VDAAFVLAVVATLAFAFTNGFHDAANAIATLVATRATRPGPAIVLAAVCNLLGPLLLGAAVADTMRRWRRWRHCWPTGSAISPPRSSDWTPPVGARPRRD
jgi:hypothetical protein